MNSKIKIKLDNLYKSFGTKKVLEGFSIDIKEKESMVFLGLSGSGKSVLIKSIAGLITPDSGKIIIDGTDMLAAPSEVYIKEQEKIWFSFPRRRLI